MAWNRLNFFAEIGTFFEKKRALQTQSGLHIVEYAAVFSKPEIGNLFA